MEILQITFKMRKTKDDEKSKALCKMSLLASTIITLMDCSGAIIALISLKVAFLDSIFYACFMRRR